MKKVTSIIVAALLAVSLFACGVVSASADTRKKGDATGDGKINMQDVTTLQKYIAELIKFDDTAKDAADVNSDGKVNMTDVTLIQKFIADLIKEFTPVETTESDGVIIIIDESDSDSSTETEFDLSVDSEGWTNQIIKP